LNRYARHTILPWFGVEGQARLAGRSVLVTGCGGTGCACSSFLARAGVGKLVLVDPDVVNLTDLQRQILYTEADIEHLKSKVDSASTALQNSNHETEVEVIHGELTSGNAASLVRGVDLVIDCSDNFETRLLINDVCLKYSKDWIHGACTGAAGMVVPFPVAGGVCYRCVVDHIPSGVASEGNPPGVLGPAAGLVGCLQAAEAIKMFVAPESVCPRIVFFDLISNTHETIGMRRKENCPACVRGLHEYLERGRREDFFDSQNGSAHLVLSGPVDLSRLQKSLAGERTVVEVGGALRVETPEAEILLFSAGRAVVRPAGNLEQARSLVEEVLKG
jgi:adenylyltransferase/sulfurtransferase